MCDVKAKLGFPSSANFCIRKVQTRVLWIRGFVAKQRAKRHSMKCDKEAVHFPKAKGFNARRMECAVPDWRALGLPVASDEHPALGVGTLKS
jgi:hypothetical protein